MLVLLGLDTLNQLRGGELEKKLILQTILAYNMSVEEGEVFHIALTYEQEYRKLFALEADGQSIRRNSIPLRTDPRRSNLFRQCWKLRRETRGLIEQAEYRSYIRANLFIIKANKGHIEPNCVTGDKSWIRYKVWKRRYDQKMAEISEKTPPPSVSTTSPKIIMEIDRTKKFLFERCEGQPTYDKILKFVENGFFRLWVTTGKISSFYLVLSPFIEKTNKKGLLFTYSTSSEVLVLEKITQEIKNYFKHEYSYEFE
jgi:hypothetical protein